MRRLTHILAVFGLLLIGSGAVRYVHMVSAHSSPGAPAAIDSCNACSVTAPSICDESDSERPADDDHSPTPDQSHDCQTCDLLAMSFAAVLPQLTLLADTAPTDEASNRLTCLCAVAVITPGRSRAPPSHI